MIREIEIRRSVRQYKETPLSEEDISIVRESINDSQPILKKMLNIKYDVILIEDGYKFYNHFKLTIGKVKAPHYLLIVSEETDEYLENTGFIGEQIVLKLTEFGIGTCWVGALANRKNKIKKIINFDNKLQPIILIAFGYPKEELQVVLNRKRKELEKIFSGKMKRSFITIAKALQAAPSSINSQPWKIIIEEDKWHFYIRPKEGLVSNFINIEKLNKIDAGIALSHILAESTKAGYIVNFRKSKIVNELKDLEYIMTVSFNR